MQCVALCLFLIVGSVCGDEFDLSGLQAESQAAIRKAMPAVVSGRPKNVPGNFSAVIVTKDGLVLTAAHCIKPKADYRLTLADGRSVDAISLGYDRRLDCGMLQIKDKGDWPTVELGDSLKIARNQPCVSISHPGTFNSSRGVVMRFGYINQTTSIRAGMIRSTCVVEPGDSGGGLFDLNGKLIGIHSQIARDLRQNFHVPVNVYRDHWNRLKKKGSFTAPVPGMPSLGFSLRATRQGVTVYKLKKDTPGARAGLKDKDVITALNGTKVPAVREFTRAYFEVCRSDATSVKLTLQTKDGAAREVTVELPERKRTSPPPDTAIEAVTRLPALLADTEDQLDDFTIRIDSKREYRRFSVLGTIVSTDGLIVSKSSMVGDNPQAQQDPTTRLPGRVIARDPDNDLVLLRVEGLGQRQAVSFNDAAARAEDDMSRGRFVLTPDPRGPGKVSVVGTEIFKSGLVTGRGLLGVQLRFAAGKAVIAAVQRGTAAAKAGFRKGDVILSINGTRIASQTDVNKVLGNLKPGSKVGVALRRGTLELGKRIALGARRTARRHAADFLTGGKSDRRDGFPQVFTHDAAVQAVECGGPLFTADGELLGLNIARHSRAQCYALPAGVVAEFIRQNVARAAETDD